MPGPTHILEMEALSTEVPNDAKGLRPCLRCSLIKNYGQFLESGCENCEFLNMISDPDKVEDCTTSYFEGTMAIFGPGWVAKWQRVITFLPGMYALELSGALPDDVIELCDNYGYEILSLLKNK